MDRPIKHKRLYRFSREVVFSGSYPQLDIQAVFLKQNRGSLIPVLVVGETTVPGQFRPLVTEYFGSPEFEIVRRNTRAQLSSTVTVGNGLRHPNVLGWGTLGGIFTRANDPAIYGLSNNHVIANFNHAHVGDAIWHPSLGSIGTLFNWFTLVEPPGVNDIDAALVRIHSNYLAQWLPPRPANGQWMPPQVGMQVVKNGFATTTTRGVITFVDGEGSAELPGRTYHFSGIIEIEGLDGPFSESGDSGSVVLSWPEQYMVGLIFAKVGDFSWALPISRIQPLLG